MLACVLIVAVWSKTSILKHSFRLLFRWVVCVAGVFLLVEVFGGDSLGMEAAFFLTILAVALPYH